MNCQHFATVLHLVMGIWIVGHVTSVLLSCDGYLDCLDCRVSWLAANTKVVHLLLFSHKKKHFFCMTFGVGRPMANTACASLYYARFDVLLFNYIDLLYTT